MPRLTFSGALYLLQCALVFMALCFAIIIFTRPSGAHSWYDPECCSTKDCAPIPHGAVQWSPEGWQVTLGPDDHPMLAHREEPHTWVVPDRPNRYGFQRVRKSRDENWHACIIGNLMVCLYKPDAGM